MTNNPDEPAFGFFSPECGTAHGLTKRELLAAMAMQGMLANSAFASSSATLVAGWSVDCADALLGLLDEQRGK